MATPAQVTANQKNATLSTGPRTPEGKQTASRNAMKFGFTSQQVVLSFESVADFEAMRNALIDQLRPATDLEIMLVDDIAAAQWRARRIENVQNSYIQSRLKSPAEGMSLMTEFIFGDEIRKFQKYAAAYRRAYESAWKKLAALQNERREQERKQEEAQRAAR